eukprot:SAG11_NODE_3702_length_2269_cov_8.750000_1_plen_227_part_10
MPPLPKQCWLYLHRRLRQYSTSYHAAVFAHRRTCVDMGRVWGLQEAMVMKVRENGFVCLIPRYGIEHIVYVDSDGATDAAAAEGSGSAQPVEWRLTEDEQALVCDGSNPRKIRVFDPVRVTICVAPNGEKLLVQLSQAPATDTDVAAAASECAAAAEAARAAGRVAIAADDQEEKEEEEEEEEEEGEEEDGSGGDGDGVSDGDDDDGNIDDDDGEEEEEEEEESEEE